MITSTSALPNPGPPLLDREGRTRFWVWRDVWWSVRAEVGLVDSAVGGGREAEVLREEVGVVVAADVAGFFPWATEDTINTRLLLDFVGVKVILEGTRMDVGSLGGLVCAFRRRKSEKNGDRSSTGCGLVSHDQRDCRRNRGYGPSFSPTSKSTECTLLPVMNPGLMILDASMYTHEATIGL